MRGKLTIADQILAVLFVSDRPASLDALCDALQATPAQVDSAIQSLGSRLAESGPLEIIKIAGGYQLCSKAPYADLVTKWLNPQKQRLSRSVLEVLAIIAYQQPITSAEIEQIRGVQCDYGLRQLQERRLIKEAGRKPSPGRPILYATTQQFLHQFALNDLGELPRLQLSLPGGPEAAELPAPREDIPLPRL